MEPKIIEAVSRHFQGKPEKIERLTDGLKHETYSFELNDEEFIIQFSGVDDENHDALQHGIDCYKLFEDTDIPVPGVATEEVEHLDDERYVIVEKISGKSAELDISQEKVFNAGRYLGKIHNLISFDEAGWISFEAQIKVYPYDEGSQKARIEGKTDEKLNVFREDGMEDLADKVERFFETNLDKLPSGFGPVFCHDDFTPDNTIYREQEVVGVIDFDYAYSGSPYWNLVKSANGFWMHDPGADWDIRKKFYEGYRKERDLDLSFQEVEPVYRVISLVWLIAGMIEMDELNQREKDFYRDEIVEEMS